MNFGWFSYALIILDCIAVVAFVIVVAKRAPSIVQWLRNLRK